MCTGLKERPVKQKTRKQMFPERQFNSTQNMQIILNRAIFRYIDNNFTIKTI